MRDSTRIYRFDFETATPNPKGYLYVQATNSEYGVRDIITSKTNTRISVMKYNLFVRDSNFIGTVGFPNSWYLKRKIQDYASLKGKRISYLTSLKYVTYKEVYRSKNLSEYHSKFKARRINHTNDRRQNLISMLRPPSFPGNKRTTRIPRFNML